MDPDLPTSTQERACTLEQPRTVLLVEDDAAFAERLLQALRDQPAAHRIEWVATLAAARAWLKANEADLLVLDLSLPDGHGLELLTVIPSALPTVVLTVATAEGELMKALDCGVQGYLLKDDVALEQRVLEVLNGAFPVSALMARHLIQRLAQATPAVGTSTSAKTLLSKRERDILEELARGASYREVARQLGISHHTVADHVKSIYPKLAVRNRSGAVHRAFELGILSPPKA